MVGDKVRAVARSQIIVRIFRFYSKCDGKPLEKFKQGNNFKVITLIAVWRKNCRGTQWKQKDLGKRCSGLDHGDSM